jgi:hypothetical protein
MGYRVWNEKPAWLGSCSSAIEKSTLTIETDLLHLLIRTRDFRGQDVDCRPEQTLGEPQGKSVRFTAEAGKRRGELPRTPPVSSISKATSITKS